MGSRVEFFKHDRGRNSRTRTAGDPALFETHEETLARHDALARFDESARTTAAGGFARLAALKYDSHPPAGDPAGVLADARALLATLDRGFRA